MRWGVKNSRIHIKQINASRSIVVRLAVTYMHVDIIIQMYVQIRERGGWRKEGERERERGGRERRIEGECTYVDVYTYNMHYFIILVYAHTLGCVCVCSVGVSILLEFTLNRRHYTAIALHHSLSTTMRRERELDMHFLLALHNSSRFSQIWTGS